ncbi:MAG TPA: hypothetical protein DEF45_00625 [Rhodopirellula sp.]|nr:hypothetical protein [Rhodopirellula sp.]
MTDVLVGNHAIRDSNSGFRQRVIGDLLYKTPRKPSRASLRRKHQKLATRPHGTPEHGSQRIGKSTLR